MGNRNQQDDFEEYALKISRLSTALNADTFLKIAESIAEKFGLTYLTEEHENNLCFAKQNENLRDDFKTHFHNKDVLNYLFSVYYSSHFLSQNKVSLDLHLPEIPYPKSSKAFWKLGSIGSKILKKDKSELEKLTQEIDTILLE